MSAAVESKADTGSLDLEKTKDANVALIDAGDVGVPEFDDPNADPDSALGGVVGELTLMLHNRFLSVLNTVKRTTVPILKFARPSPTLTTPPFWCPQYVHGRWACFGRSSFPSAHRFTVFPNANR